MTGPQLDQVQFVFAFLCDYVAVVTVSAISLADSPQSRPKEMADQANCTGAYQVASWRKHFPAAMMSPRIPPSTQPSRPSARQINWAELKPKPNQGQSRKSFRSSPSDFAFVRFIESLLPNAY